MQRTTTDEFELPPLPVRLRRRRERLRVPLAIEIAGLVLLGFFLGTLILRTAHAEAPCAQDESH